MASIKGIKIQDSFLTNDDLTTDSCGTDPVAVVSKINLIKDDSLDDKYIVNFEYEIYCDLSCEDEHQDPINYQFNGLQTNFILNLESPVTVLCYTQITDYFDNNSIHYSIIN